MIENKIKENIIKENITDGNIIDEYNLNFHYPNEIGFTIYSKSGCKYCSFSKNLLIKNKHNFLLINCDDYLINNKNKFLDFIEKIIKRPYKLFPMIFNDGKFIGGYIELEIFLSNKYNDELKKKEEAKYFTFSNFSNISNISNILQSSPFEKYEEKKNFGRKDNKIFINQVFSHLNEKNSLVEKEVISKNLILSKKKEEKLNNLTFEENF
jgi:glutaredoxin